MKRSWNIKKIVIAVIVLLLCCDVSLLFAAQFDSGNGDQQLALQQVQQLQQQSPTDQTSQNGSNPAATNIAVASTAQPSSNGNIVQASDSAQSTPSGLVSTGDVNSAAFGSVTQSLLPMTPEQIQRLRQLFDQSQYAAAALPTVPSRPVISSQFVNLAPGSTPAVVRLQQGMVSVLTFIDSTGAPWPIQAYDVGNPAAFNIQWNKSDNTMIIQPLTPYTYGNLAVVLQGLSTPIMLSLTTGQKAFDARIDLHVQGLGPNAQAVVAGGIPNGTNPELLGVLDGVGPAGATVMQVSGGQAQVWLSGNQLYVRTRATILSPGWIQTMSSADGTKAYLLPKTPLLLATQDGKIIQLKIEGL